MLYFHVIIVFNGYVEKISKMGIKLIEIIVLLQLVLED